LSLIYRFLLSPSFVGETRLELPKDPGILANDEIDSSLFGLTQSEDFILSPVLTFELLMLLIASDDSTL
jgi:hypothetical protein